MNEDHKHNPSGIWMDRLIELVPPPVRPNHHDNETPRNLTTDFNLPPLPTDYIQISSLYGKGCFYDDLWVALPEGSRGILQQHLYYGERMDDLRRDDGGILFDEFILTYRLYPQNDGLLFFAHGHRGGRCFWQTAGSPDNWKLTFISSDLVDHEQFPGGLAEFLVRWWDKSFDSSVFGNFAERNRPGETPTFRPHPVQ